MLIKTCKDFCFFRKSQEKLELDKSNKELRSRLEVLTKQKHQLQENVNSKNLTKKKKDDEKTVSKANCRS